VKKIYKKENVKKKYFNVSMQNIYIWTTKNAIII